jgi:hypothetical protein
MVVFAMLSGIIDDFLIHLDYAGLFVQFAGEAGCF